MDNAVHSSLPLWACLASLLAAPVIVLFRREPSLREGATFVSAFVKLGLVLAMLPIVAGGKVIDQLYDRHLKSLEKVAGLDNAELDSVNKALQKLERFWTDHILYRL